LLLLPDEALFLGRKISLWEDGLMVRLFDGCPNLNQALPMAIKQFLNRHGTLHNESNP
jgi:hypothetical protein